MAIKSKNMLNKRKVEIDLSGPQGNCLLSGKKRRPLHI